MKALIRTPRRLGRSRLIVGIFGAALLLAACGSDDPAPEAEPDAASADQELEEAPDEPEEAEADDDFEPRTVRVLANWLAQASQGGYWQAAADGLAEDAGVMIEGLSGGPGIATVTNVAIGEAEYGMTAIDNILMARAEGIPIVAVWGGMDVSPQCFMAHASASVETFEDLNGLKISTSPAGTFWPVIRARYGIEPAEELPVVDFGTWANDEEIVRQCFNISEKFLAEQEGWDATFLMVHDSGYQTYAQMLFTTEDRIREHPQEVAAVVAAVQEGWERFLNGQHQSGLDLIIENNPDYSVEEAEYAIPIMRDELFGDPLGHMEESRIEAVFQDLVDAELITVNIDWQSSFTTEFLP